MDLLVTAQQGLDSLIYRLWQIAQDRKPESFLLRIVDHPASVKAILHDITAFRKNYAFLESFSHGRFSDNGTSWSARTPLTQPQYSKNIILKHSAMAHPIYSDVFSQLNSHSSVEDIGAAALDAAVRIFSQAFNLETTIPWDNTWATRVRNALVKRQWIGFAGVTPEQFHAIESDLQQLREECARQWQAIPEIQALLERFRMMAGDLADFDPVQELIQNIIASSETTAATVMWAATILGCRQDLQEQLRSGQLGVEQFIQELLRLYPPVPFISRVAEKDIQLEHESFQQGEAFLISIFNLHYSAFWPDATQFKPERFNEEQPLLRDHYLPFSIGPRACGGRKLAELELRTAVTVLLEKFHLTVPDPASITATYGLSFRPVVPKLILRAV